MKEHGANDTGVPVWMYAVLTFVILTDDWFTRFFYPIVFLLSIAGITYFLGLHPLVIQYLYEHVVPSGKRYANMFLS